MEDRTLVRARVIARAVSIEPLLERVEQEELSPFEMGLFAVICLEAFLAYKKGVFDEILNNKRRKNKKSANNS